MGKPRPPYSRRSVQSPGPAPAGAPSPATTAGTTPPSRSDWQHRRDGVIALEPDHLLGKIVWVRQIRPPGGNGDFDHVRSRREFGGLSYRAANLFKSFGHHSAANRPARDAGGQLPRHAHRTGHRPGPLVSRRAHDSSAQLYEEFGYAQAGDGRKLAVHSSFEPTRRFAG